ncbi:MAG: methylmalonyl-CoA mutase family protein [Myxococcota bacterium]|nr:methylmalonyl-CoA mutase family protein [Myxococcota bacterium]
MVTAASLFDGHDAAINIIRRILQSQGAEVIHLGHDRSVDEIVEAAIQEDAHAIAVSSYQGGHNEFFRYMIDRLRERGAGHVRVYGGGGGTILPDEIEALQAYGVARIFTPEDGRALGLEGMVKVITAECDRRTVERIGDEPQRASPEDPGAVARLISWMEDACAGDGQAEIAALREQLAARDDGHSVVVGFTGTGGAGKSSVVDELVRRFRGDFPECSVGLVLVDPTRRRSGGALLGDRIRMNAIHAPRIYARSLATRQAHLALARAVRDSVLVLRAAGYDLIFVETAGIGQSDSEIVDLVDLSLYVMTPEYGAPSQLEKIDMLELADLVVLNKLDRQGGLDALRDVRKQWRRNHSAFDAPDEELPVYPTTARDWSDPGTDVLYEELRQRVAAAGGAGFAQPAAGAPQRAAVPRAVESVESAEPSVRPMIPGARRRYLAEIAETVRAYRARTEELAAHAVDAASLEHASALLAGEDSSGALAAARDAARDRLDPALREQLDSWPAQREAYARGEQEYSVRDRAIRVRNHVETLSGTPLPRVALPRAEDWGTLTRYLRQENLPGHFPFSAGVFPFKREAEEPARMFAGEGGPERTNRRFHFLSADRPAARLSTAFDSVTLYGRNPDERPDIYGKVGNSGVSVCTLDCAKKLYSGFDLCDPSTSVSMTINGPAPTILACYLNAAVDQQVERQLRERGDLAAVRARIAAGRELPVYGGGLHELPPGHDGLGLGLLGIRGDEAVDAESYARIRADVLRRVRGTVQADILKEDQAQNTCIFSCDFSLALMGDIQAWFIQNDVRNFYSVSISGYHIAEAGANPITQLAFTLANGFTYVEYYRSRGMEIDAFVPNFSFFFSNGLDAEYNVIGRVARRIWAIAMREQYGASERSQKLKYHIQTSGRSLHAQEMAFNDIRTTLQALTALQDNCNSLHTNAYDEAVTTPTEESVRRALAIQLIIQRELGLASCENAIQGSYAIDELTDRVEEAVLREFERLSERGGVLGAMETQYQRSKIQQESLHYESLKHSGSLPIVGVNMFENPDAQDASARPGELMRSSNAEKDAQLAHLREFEARNAAAAPKALERLRRVALTDDNVFEELMETVKVASLGAISDALFQVGGRYRRSM